jgi:heme exporter protein C
MGRQILAILSFISILIALYCALIYAPTESTMGSIQRIFYFHVPQGILSYTSALIVGLGCVMFLVTNDFKWDRLAYCAAELGVLFSCTSMVTGMIWAKPVWGAWWVFDARLTAQLALALLFVSYFMLRAYVPEREKKARLSTVFGFLAMLDVPINYLSIWLWTTQHPQPVIGGGGYLDPDMAVALSVSLVAFCILYAYLLAQRLAVAKIEEEVGRLEEAALAA